MKNAFAFGSIFGIPVRVHWTFLILLVWVGLVSAAQGQVFPTIALEIFFVICIFVCVVLHELSHALMARRFGIKTRDILLLPIGGVSRLERMPEDFRQEFLVAVVGPLTSLAIAGLLYVVLVVQGEPINITAPNFLTRLMWINVFLAGFNFLPAFPMDGGRILRSLLAPKMGYARATAMAAGVGQAVAIGFGILGLMGNPILLLIAVFVFFGAQQEASMVLLRSMLAGVRVRSAMLMHCQSLSIHDDLHHAVRLLLEGSQEDFPVEENGKFAGLLTRKALLTALKEGSRDQLVSAVMNRNCPSVSENDPLDKTWQMMREQDWPAVPVIRDGKLVGLLTLHNIMELLMVEEATQKTISR